jgi:hypothetical protein
MQKPQSRGDATIVINRWLEILRYGAEISVSMTTSAHGVLL